MATVNLYNTTQLDCYKVAGAMYTELDYGIAEVVDALKEKDMFDLLIFVSDNGGPLDHTTNSPLRGGKHTFFEGGVRVMSFISGPAVPPARRGTRWTGMAHSSDWYVTVTPIPSRFVQTRESTQAAISDTYNGDGKVYSALRAAAYVSWEILSFVFTDADW